MTDSRHKIYAYWGSRPENAIAYAKRLRQTLVDLSAIHPVFANWKQGHTPAIIPVFSSTPPELPAVVRLIEEGRHYADGSGELMPDIGFSVGIKSNLARRCSCMLDVTAGGYSGHRRFPNTLNLESFVNDLRDAELQSFEAYRSELRAIATAWEPDWASVYCSAYWQRLATAAGKWLDIQSGWMTYLSPDYARHVVPPAGAIVEAAPAAGGMVLVATKESFDVTNPTHLAAADAIQVALAPLNVTPWRPNDRAITNSSDA